MEHEILLVGLRGGPCRFPPVCSAFLGSDVDRELFHVSNWLATVQPGRSYRAVDPAGPAPAMENVSFEQTYVENIECHGPTFSIFNFLPGIDAVEEIETMRIAQDVACGGAFLFDPPENLRTSQQQSIFNMPIDRHAIIELFVSARLAQPQYCQARKLMRLAIAHLISAPNKFGVKEEQLELIPDLLSSADRCKVEKDQPGEEFLLHNHVQINTAAEHGNALHTNPVLFSVMQIWSYFMNKDRFHDIFGPNAHLEFSTCAYNGRRTFEFYIPARGQSVHAVPAV